MAISLKHDKVSGVSDGGDSNKVQPSDWNAEHDLTAGANVVLGTTSAGAVGEISCTSAGRDLLDDANAAAQLVTLGAAPSTPKFITSAAHSGLSAEIVVPGLAGDGDISGIGGGGTSEEYDTATTGLTWSPSDPDTVNSNTARPSYLYIKSVDSTERFGTKAWSPAGAFDVRAKVSFGSHDGSTEVSLGLIVMDSDNSNRVVTLLNNVTAQFRVMAFTYAASTYSQRGTSWLYGANQVYLRVTRDGSNNVSFWFGSDNYSWQLVATQSFTFTPTKVGFRTGPGGSVTMEGYVDWLRTDV